jgi:hypothetical protein
MVQKRRETPLKASLNRGRHPWNGAGKRCHLREACAALNAISLPQLCSYASHRPPVAQLRKPAHAPAHAETHQRPPNAVPQAASASLRKQSTLPEPPARQPLCRCVASTPPTESPATQPLRTGSTCPTEVAAAQLRPCERPAQCALPAQRMLPAQHMLPACRASVTAQADPRLLRSHLLPGSACVPARRANRSAPPFRPARSRPFQPVQPTCRTHPPLRRRPFPPHTLHQRPTLLARH